MSEWKEYRLSEVADIRVSNVDKKTLRSEQPVQLCNYMDVYSNKYVRSGIDFMVATANLGEIERFNLKKGDVLITKDSETPFDIGIPSVLVDDVENLVCGYHLALIRPKFASVDPIYLSKALASTTTKRYYAQVAAGSTRYGLSNGAIAKTIVRAPSLPAQKKIAKILQTVDEAIEKTEALIEKYSQIKAGMMQDLFTRGLTPDGKLRPPRSEAPELYQETPIGWIPKEWGWGHCEEYCARICVGIVIRPADYYVSDGIPTFRSANVRENGIDESSLVYISKQSNQSLFKSQIRSGDILTVRTGYPGTSAVVPDYFDGCNCVDILITTPADTLDSDFLCYWVNSTFGKGQVLRKQGGLAQQHFNVGEMRDLIVVQPNKHEQLEVVRRLDIADTKIAREKLFLDKLKLQKSGLMHDLLTGERPVKIDDPEPADV